jgi:undecaprenyl-diphosphatase
VRNWRAFAERVAHIAAREVGALAAFVVLASGLLAFTYIAEEVVEADAHAFDMAVLQLLRPQSSAPADPIGPWWLAYMAEDVTALGSTAVLGLVTAISAGFLLMQRKRGSAVLLVFALAGAVVLSELTKKLFGVERPPEIYRTFKTLNASFPSGHALLATTFYLTLGVVLARSQERRRVRAYLVGVAVLLALLVGGTRIFLAAHWTTDVLAGVCLGASWAMLCWLTAYGLQRRRVLGRDEPLRQDE